VLRLPVLPGTATVVPARRAAHFWSTKSPIPRPRPPSIVLRRPSSSPVPRPSSPVFLRIST
jgi:hypothetical protein